MRLALFDLDGTVLRGNSWQEFFWWLVRSQPARAPGLLARLALRKAGMMEGRALRESALRLWRGREMAELAAVGQRVADTRLRGLVRPRARRELARAAADGCTLVLATGAFEFLAEPIAAELGVREVVCTRLELADNKITGRIAGEEAAGVAKTDGVRARFTGREVDWARSRAFSDSVEDAPLFALVGEPVFVTGGAVRPAELATNVCVEDWDAPEAAQ